MFTKRKTVNGVTSLLLSVLFASVMVATATADLFLQRRLTADSRLAYSVRIPSVGIYRDTMTGGASYRTMRIRKGRGDRLAPKTLRIVRAYDESRRPPSKTMLVGLALAFLLIGLLYSSYLRSRGGESAHLRTQLVLFAALIGLALLSKALLLFTVWSPMWLPLTLAVIPAAVLLGRRTAAATALIGAAIIALLTPIDWPLLGVFLAQGIAAAMATARRGGRGRVLLGGLGAAAAGVAAHAAITLVLLHFVPLGLDLSSISASALLQSDLVGALAAPILACFFVLLLTPAIERALGQLSKARLIALADFEAPLLRRIATTAPGTWAHSLNMANMAEMAANAISANALLVRVGAYYHDVGKTIQPDYFIENQQGENPHDELDPEVSADAIFSHVSEGVKLARKHKVPQAVCEFAYTHHGNGTLEYFWHQAMAAGNPRKSDESDFRYPGIPPQTRETGILALCDAAEAASKTLKNPDLDQVKKLVQQIVFTKLEQGMLDESGLTIEELRKVTQSMVETLKSSFHVRVKYPWQKDDGTKETGASAEKTAIPAKNRPTDEPAAPPKKPARSSVDPPVRINRPARKDVVEAPLVEAEGAADPAWTDSVNGQRERVHTRPLGASDPDPPAR